MSQSTMNKRLPQEANRLTQIEAGLDLLDQGITVFDADLKLIAWNTPFIEILAFPPQMAYLGADFESFIRYNAERGEYGPGDVTALIKTRIEAAKNFQPHDFERTRPDGRILRIHGEPLPYRGFITLYTDVTEQRRFERLAREQNTILEERVTQRTALLEKVNAGLREANESNSRMTEALRRSEGQLRLITDTIPALIAYFDSTQIYRYANKGYCDWFGKSIDEVIGESIHNIIGVRALESVKHHIARALSGEQVTYEYAMLQNSIKVHARSTLVPEFSQSGLVVGCFVLSFDITDQKRLQAALIQAQKMEAIGQLSSGIAHDFNNLLTIIIGNLALLMEQTPNNPALQDLVSPALDAGKRGAQLVQRLLSFSRQQPLKPAVINVQMLIHDMTHLLERSLPSRIRLDIDLGKTPLITRIDAHQLENALLNLVVNARDAMPDGGALTIKAYKTLLQADQAREFDLPEGDYVRIDVTDTGIGMPPEIQSRIFEPFFTTKNFGQGSGLGLAMIYGFVKQSGGGIVVDSEPDQGTEMRIVLPTHTIETEESLVAETEQPGVRRQGQLVLLVEDDNDVRQIVRKHLLDLGHPVVEADNVIHGMEMIVNIPEISILLTDVIMPGNQNGREMAQAAKRLRPDLHVIIMSGFEDLGKAQSTRLSFASLSKPFTKRQLAKALGQS